jgi:salicylate hydroxylase
MDESCLSEMQVIYMVRRSLPATEATLTAVALLPGGAFAAGGGLAVEDAYTLALSIAHILKLPGPPISNLPRALDLYNRARLPHVNKFVRAANGMRSTVKGRSWSDEEILAAVGKVGINELDWLAENPTKQVWEDVVNEDESTKT